MSERPSPARLVVMAVLCNIVGLGGVAYRYFFSGYSLNVVLVAGAITLVLINGIFLLSWFVLKKQGKI